MDERVAQLFDDRLVELGLRTLGHELDLLAELDGQIAHDPPELVEGASDREHADAHGIVAKLGDEPLELLGYRG